MKKLLLFSTLIGTLILLSTGYVLAETDKGPADIILESTVDPAKKPKPSIFPHGEHQGRLECSDCHHSKDDAGKRVDYTDGQAIEKCESCHNSSSDVPKKLATFKGAAHQQCKTCHKENSKDLAKCGTCHKKQ